MPTPNGMETKNEIKINETIVKKMRHTLKLKFLIVQLVIVNSSLISENMILGLKYV